MQHSSVVYTVKSAYKAIIGEMMGSQLEDTYVQMWKIKLPPKVIILLWRTMSNKLPTGENIRKRNIQVQNWNYSCPLCGEGDETTNHILLSCKEAVRVWNFVTRGMNYLFLLPENIKGTLLTTYFDYG